MGDIVGGFAVSHILMSPNGIEERAERVFAGMREIGERIQKLKPDVIVVVSNDHMFNFNLSFQAPFVVGVSDSYTPFGEMDIPTAPHEGHRDFAEGFIAYAAERDFDIAKAEEIKPDHGMAVPLTFANPARKTKIVPLYIDLNMSPTPRPKRCWKLGETLRDYIAKARPANERVVVLATGGLSHAVGMPEPLVNEEFDRRFLKDIEAGTLKSWIALSPAEIEKTAGNGGLEIIHWLFMAATLSSPKSEIIFYEPVVEWLTGMGGIAAIPASARSAAA